MMKNWFIKEREDAPQANLLLVGLLIADLYLYSIAMAFAPQFAPAKKGFYTECKQHGRLFTHCLQDGLPCQQIVCSAFFVRVAGGAARHWGFGQRGVSRPDED